MLVDLQGPKIRVGMVDDHGVRVDPGREVVLVAGADRALEAEIPVVYRELATDVHQGDQILLDDADLRRVLRLLRIATENLSQRTGRHRACGADLALAADFCAGEIQAVC